MPVIDSRSFLQGILSERDLLKFTINSLRNSPIEANQERVRDIMQTKVLSAFPETPIREIARIMFEEKWARFQFLTKKKTSSRNRNKKRYTQAGNEQSTTRPLHLILFFAFTHEYPEGKTDSV